MYGDSPYMSTGVFGWPGYLFSSESQLVTTVIGNEAASSMELLIKNLWPSGVTT
jgi:hypothetical protein